MDELDYEVFFNESIELLCVANLEGYFVTLNPRWSELLGHSIEELKSKPFIDFVHPEDDNIRGLSHMLWTGDPLSKDSDARNAVFYGDKAIDRSPCGTGTSARMAQWVAKGKLKKGESFVHESIIGSKFTGTVEELVKCGPYDAIIPGIEGWARITGYNQIIIDDEDDPYAFGFQVI